MRVELEDAIVLHRRAYRETSLLLEVFAREYGRVGLLARGARRPKARWRGMLEPLHRLRLSWSGRGELRTLTAAEAAGSAAPLSGERLYAGFYAAELLLRTTARDDAHPALFDRMDWLLRSLAAGHTAGRVLRVFERDLLAEIGYAPPLTAETDSGRAVRADCEYLYDPRGVLRRAVSAPADDEVAVSGAALLALAAGELGDPAHARAARRLLNAALSPHLGGRPLKTAETLRALQRLRRR